jgi:hypothetical protein
MEVGSGLGGILLREFYSRRPLPRPKSLRRILNDIRKQEAASRQRTPSRL